MKTNNLDISQVEFIKNKIQNYSDSNFNVDIDKITNEVVYNQTTNEVIKLVSLVCEINTEQAKNFVVNLVNENCNEEQKSDLVKENILFSYYKKPISNTIPYKNIDLLQLYKVIKDPKFFGKQTTELRNLQDKSARAKYKQTEFDFVLFSGIFPPSKRNSKSCEQKSSYLCIDIDHVSTNLNELKHNLLNDSILEVQLLFTSPSGDGIKAVLPYNVNEFENFTDVFLEIEKYILENYKIQIDKACKNIDRACFLCFDSEVYINPKLLLT